MIQYRSNISETLSQLLYMLIYYHRDTWIPSKWYQLHHFSLNLSIHIYVSIYRSDDFKGIYLTHLKTLLNNNNDTFRQQRSIFDALKMAIYSRFIANKFARRYIQPFAMIHSLAIVHDCPIFRFQLQQTQQLLRNHYYFIFLVLYGKTPDFRAHWSKNWKTTVPVPGYRWHYAGKTSVATDSFDDCD